MNCPYIFKKGKNQNSICNKLNCKLHKNKMNLISLFDIPDEIINIITSYINNFQDLKNLTLTCSILYNNSENYFERLYNYHKLRDHKIHHFNDLSYKKRFELLYELGCERCNTPRIKKISYPFPIRMCQSCVQEITISEYRLKEYEINENVYHDLKYMKATLWSRYHGSYTLNFYLIKDINDRLGISLNEYINQNNQNVIDNIKKIYPDFEDSGYISKNPITVNQWSSTGFDLYVKIFKQFILNYRGMNHFKKIYSEDVISKSKIIKKAFLNEKYDEVKKEDIDKELEQIRLHEKLKEMKDKYENNIYINFNLYDFNKKKITEKYIQTLEIKIEQDIIYNTFIKEIDDNFYKYNMENELLIEKIPYYKDLRIFKNDFKAFKDKYTEIVDKAISDEHLRRDEMLNNRSKELGVAVMYCSKCCDYSNLYTQTQLNDHDLKFHLIKINNNLKSKRNEMIKCTCGNNGSKYCVNIKCKNCCENTLCKRHYK